MSAFIGGLLLASTVGVGGFLLVVFFVKRLLAWLDEHDYIIYNGHVPTYGSLGNAFMELHQLAEPQKAYVLEMKEELKLKREEDGEAGSANPDALHGGGSRSPRNTSLGTNSHLRSRTEVISFLACESAMPFYR